MWYELLINGYTWFTNQSEYTPNIKLAESVGGELNEGFYTRNEVSQIRQQLNDYQTLGFNSQLKHLNRTGIHEANDTDEGGGSMCCGKRMTLASSGIVYVCSICGGWDYSSS
jgi:hypothetical protein